MLDTAGLITQINGCFDKDAMITNLKAQGFTDSDISSIDTQLTTVNTTTVADSDISPIVDSVTADVTSQITDILTQYRTQQSQKNNDGLKDAHQVFNAKQSINIPEPQFSGAKFTSPVNLDDANYSTKEDYPDSYGFIDSIKNWWKVNKAKKKAELVMASGTLIKTDSAGNVTMFIKGSLKQIVQGDYSLQVGGSNDVIINGSRYVKVGSALEEDVTGSWQMTAGTTSTLKSTGQMTLSGAPLSLN